jgi:hypothetical protein
VTIEIDEHGRTVWCPLEYEHLPDFCFVCGVLGHSMRGCSIKLVGKDKPQFGNWLKADLGRRRVGQDVGGRKFDGHGSTGSRGSGGARWGGSLRSDSACWRKGDTGSGGSMDSRPKKGDGFNNLAILEECPKLRNNPEKIFNGTNIEKEDGKAVEGRVEGVLVVHESSTPIKRGQEMEVDVIPKAKIHGGTTGQISSNVVGEELGIVGTKNKEGKRYKKVIREKAQGNEFLCSDNVLGKKHFLTCEEEEDRTGKRGKKEEGLKEGVSFVSSTFLSAGLQEQPRREQ